MIKTWHVLESRNFNRQTETLWWAEDEMGNRCYAATMDFKGEPYSPGPTYRRYSEAQAWQECEEQYILQNYQM